jgi:hypothetical protein
MKFFAFMDTTDKDINHYGNVKNQKVHFNIVIGDNCNIFSSHGHNRNRHKLLRTCQALK